jgi:hypothetical protein
MVVRQRLAAYYSAAAARGRRLLTRATTPWLREHLGAEIARCDSMAEEIERATEPAVGNSEEEKGPDKQPPAPSLSRKSRP